MRRKKQTTQDKMTSRMDTFVNSLTGLNVDGVDHRIGADFQLRPDISRETCWGMYRQNALFARIIDLIPESCIRRGVRVTGDAGYGGADDEFSKGVMSALDGLNWQEKFIQWLRLDRVEGGALMIIGADDGQDPAEELTIERVRSIEFLQVVSRYDAGLGDIDLDPFSPSFRQPVFFNFTTPMGTRRIHASRVLRLDGIRADGLVSTFQWGSGVVDRVWEAVRQFDSIYDYMEGAFKDLIQGVMSIEDLAGMLSMDDGNAVLLKRIHLINMMASAFNMVLLDKEETYERRVTSVAGHSEAIIRVMDRLAMAAEAPLSILFGQPPTGLSTDDASGRRMFASAIANKQQSLVRRPLMRLIEMIVNSTDGPTSGDIPDSWHIEFLPLEQPSEKEDAETRKIQAETDAAYVDLGALTVEEARTRLTNDPRCPYILDEAIETETVIASEDLLQPEAPLEVKAADTALNGAQITSALEIVDRVARGNLPRASGISMLIEFFNIESGRAERIMGEVGRGFKVETPAPVSPETDPGNTPEPVPFYP